MQHKFRCLVIDDEPLARLLIEKHLSTEPEFVLVGACKNTMQAETFLEENEIDLIFLDINMPVMNGWQFLDEYHKIIEQFKKPIYIYMVSSSVDDCDIQRSREYSGVTDYIVKPINKIKYQELIDRLNFYNG